MTQNPLTAADIQNIRNAIALSRELDGEIKKAEACEIDCENMSKRCENAKRRLSKMNEIYGAEFKSRKA